MMGKAIVLITLVLLVVIGGVSLLGQDTGYVYIKINDTNIELSLLLLLVLILMFAVALHYLWKFANKTFGLKKEIKQWQEHRDLNQAHKKLSQGFVALGEGNYTKAQKMLDQAAKKTKYSLVPLLGAANAAQQQGDEESRDFFLNKALEENPEASLSLRLTKADHLVSLAKYKDAQFVLDNLGKKIKNNPVALRIQANIYSRSAQWEKLLPMIPQLYKKTNLNREEVQQLEEQAHVMGLRNANGLLELQSRWKNLPKEVGQQKEMLLDYVHRLTRHEEYSKASKVLMKSLKDNWDEDLAVTYAQLPLEDTTKQIRLVEDWLVNHNDSAALNLALAQLYIQKELWVMAQDKLDVSIAIEDSSAAQTLSAQVTSKLLDHDS